MFRQDRDQGMDVIIDETLSDQVIEQFANSYNKLKGKGNEEEIQAKFQYAYALLRSQHTHDIRHGINIFENLYYDGQENAKRDYLYYIAIGQTRLKNYQLALESIDHFLQFEPDNQQAQRLRRYIKQKLTSDGIMGMAITGGIVLVGGLIGLALSKK